MPKQASALPFPAAFVGGIEWAARSALLPNRKTDSLLPHPQEASMKIRYFSKLLSMAIVTLMIALQLTAAGYAQSESTTGSIEGTISDSTGGVVADARVTAT